LLAQKSAKRAWPRLWHPAPTSPVNALMPMKSTGEVGAGTPARREGPQGYEVARLTYLPPINHSPIPNHQDLRAAPQTSPPGRLACSIGAKTEEIKTLWRNTLSLSGLPACPLPLAACRPSSLFRHPGRLRAGSRFAFSPDFAASRLGPGNIKPNGSSVDLTPAVCLCSSPRCCRQAGAGGRLSRDRRPRLLGIAVDRHVTGQSGWSGLGTDNLRSRPSGPGVHSPQSAELSAVVPRPGLALLADFWASKSWIMVLT
jgi:hypothetical protein